LKRKRANLSRNKLLKRNAWFHVLNTDPEDAKWLWAAYVLKSFTGFIEDGYEQEVFDEGIQDVMARAAGEGLVYVLEARHVDKEKPIPVGLVVVRIFKEALWPEAHWFSWATPRNKIEASVALLQELQKDGPVTIFAEKNQAAFLSHMGRYGVLSRKATLHRFNGESRVFYYAKRKE